MQALFQFAQHIYDMGKMDPDQYLRLMNPDPDPGGQKHADPDPQPTANNHTLRQKLIYG